jgi:hypothetical protein
MYTARLSVIQPTSKSAKARLKVKQLNCVRSSLLGSIVMAKHTSKLVGTVTISSTKENEAVTVDNSDGDVALRQPEDTQSKYIANFSANSFPVLCC